MGMTRHDRRGLRLPAVDTLGRRLIEASDVSVAYDGVPVVDEASLVVRSGEVLALVGPNGAGKSTLLSALAGDIEIENGQVLVDGAPHAEWTPDELAVRRGVLLQQTEGSFPFTVTEIVRMGRTPWVGTSAEDWDEAVVAGSLIETDLAAFPSRVYMSLSGGERSRAALARVLAQEPRVLLLDEPTSSLDIRHQQLVMGLTRLRARRGDGVVVVLHDLSLAGTFADRVVVMSQGRIVADGPPDHVLTSQLLSEVYEHPIEIIRHPVTGGIIVVPWHDEDPAATGTSAGLSGSVH